MGSAGETARHFSDLTDTFFSVVTGSEGTGNGSDEEGSKVSAGGSESDSDNAASADDGIDEEETKDLATEENLTEDEEKSKRQQSSDSSTKDTPTVIAPKGRRKTKKISEPAEAAETGSSLVSASNNVNAEESQAEPKKWNFRRNRPLLDFTTMEDLNEMDDYDSEDDNDWRPTAGKKKGKANSQKGGTDEEGGESASDDDDNDDDDDDDDDDEDSDGDDDDDDKEDGEDNINSSSDSDKEAKKSKKKTKSSSAFDEELTNDSMSQGKGSEVSTRSDTFQKAVQTK